MEPEDRPARRRPAPRPPALPDERPEASEEPPGGRRGRPAGRIALAAAVVVVALIGVAVATGDARDLPWGAIVGVAVLLGLILLTRRRRA